MTTCQRLNAINDELKGIGNAYRDAENVDDGPPVVFDVGVICGNLESAAHSVSFAWRRIAQRTAGRPGFDAIADTAVPAVPPQAPVCNTAALKRVSELLEAEAVRLVAARNSDVSSWNSSSTWIAATAEEHRQKLIDLGEAKQLIAELLKRLVGADCQSRGMPVAGDTTKRIST